jgi:hypothetical protein
MSQRFPTGAEYVDALQNTELCFRDPDLRSAVPELDRLGRPRAISGSFASVFSLTSTGGTRFAVKCFTHEVADQKFRYQAISDHLSTLDYRWKVGFDFLPEGILVAGSWYPVLKMQWVTGTGLTRWIDQNHDDGPGLMQLAEHFAELVTDLSAAEIGHGDLQHGNLLVAPDRSLRLVDYDGMYVPALFGLGASELGHRNYQSPARGNMDFGPDIDRFSAWVIYLSLIAVAIEPSFWSRLHEQDGEYLLLAEDDFKNPDASDRFSQLLAHPSAEVREMAAKVRDLAATPIHRLPRLTPSSKGLVGRAALPTPQATVSSPHQGLPAWMVDHVPRAAPPPPIGFAGHRSAGLMPILVIAAVTVAILLVATPATLGIQAGTAAGGLVACVLALRATYRARPETRAALHARKRVSETHAMAEGPKSALRLLEGERAALDQRAKRQTEEFDRRRLQLDNATTQAIQRIERDLQQRLSRINNSIQRLARDRQEELDDALAELQEEHVRARLKRIQLDADSVTGIGRKLVDKLRSHGISTPTDFTEIDLSYSSGRYQNVIAQFILADSGQRVRVDGIGEVKALALNEWRRGHIKRAQLSQPRSLPLDRQATISNKYRQREAALRADMEAARSNAASAQKATRQRSAADQVRLSDERRNADLEIIRLRTELNQRISASLADGKNFQRAVETAEIEAGRHHRITFYKYLRFLLTG